VRDDHLPAKSSASRLSGRCYIGGARYTIYGSDPDRDETGHHHRIYLTKIGF
jgi:hypothetical protein